MTAPLELSCSADWCYDSQEAQMDRLLVASLIWKLPLSLLVPRNLVLREEAFKQFFLHRKTMSVHGRELGRVGILG